jgi:hypothetical protein
MGLLEHVVPVPVSLLYQPLISNSADWVTDMTLGSSYADPC